MGESESALRRAFDAAAVGIAITDLEGRFLEANSAYCRIVGYSEEELRGMGFMSFTFPEDRALNAALIADILAGRREDFSMEKRYRTRRGTVWVRMSVAAERDASGAVQRLVGVAEDITAHKRAERQTRVLDMTSKVAQLGAWWVDLPSGDTHWSEGVYAVFGLPPDHQPTVEDAIGRFIPEHQVILQAAFDRAIGDRQPFDLALELIDTGGRHVWIRNIGEPVVDASGAVVRVQGAFLDVSKLKDTEASLEENLRRFHGLADAMPLIMWTATADGVIDYVNNTFYSFSGLTGDVDPHASWPTLVHPDDREKVLGVWSASLASGEPLSTEYRLRRHDGVYRWIRTEGTPLVAPDGRRQMWFGTVLDIDESRRNQEAMRASEERFRLLARATNDAVWDWTIATDDMWWNEGFEKLFGYARSELEPGAASWESRVHPDDKARIYAGLDAIMGGAGDSWSDEYRFRCKDGSYRRVVDRGHVIRNAEGRVVRIIGGMTDVTSRREAEQRTAELAELVEKAQDAIVVRDLEGRISYLNRRAVELYGWSEAESVGADVRHLQFAQSVEALERANEATIRDGAWSGELAQSCRNGRTVLVEGRWTLLRRPDGTPYGVLAINTDVTGKRRLEQQLLRAQRLESLGTLAGGIAHDLNNVLTPILTTATALHETETDPTKREDFAVLESAALRGAEMVQQLLLFARGDEASRGARVNLGRVVSEVAKLVRETFPRNITATVQAPPGVWSVTANLTQMHQLLMNLCVNARDAMPSGGTLTVSVENVVLDHAQSARDLEAQPGPYVLLRVEDTGTGIPAAIQERIFEPFFTTKEVGKGTGLGLSTTHAIVRNHRGFLHLYSEEGKGTRFMIYLPAEITAQEAEEASVRQASLPRGNGELVLVVDDEEAVRHVTGRTLERYGYRVVTAPNGAAAVSAFARAGGEVAVVLTDMSMPVMDGPALVVALKSLDADVKIIGSSGLDANGKVAKAMAAGVTDFVPKPYTSEALLQAIRRIIDRAADKKG